MTKRSYKRNETGGTSDSKRRVLTGLLLLAIGLMTAMGTIGCGMTAAPGPRTTANAASPTSNNSTGGAGSDSNTSVSPASTSSGGTITPSNGSSTTATAAGAILSASASGLNFGNVQVGSSTSQLITLTNNSNSTLIISAISTSGTGFTTTGSSNITMMANQAVNVYVNFAPTTTGSASGAVIIASNAMNSMVSISLSGTGVTPQSSTRSVALSWTPSSSNVVGYYVNRSTTTGGPYTRLSASVDASASYTDTTVSSGTYFYVVTAVDSNNVESAYSNEVQAIVP